MEMRDYLEIGAKKAGSLTNLGKLLDLSQPFMSRVKSGEKGLPIDAAVKLADYIGADLRSVVAENELITEKKPEKRAFWSPFVEHAKAAVLAVCALFFVVTSFLTPSPAQAMPSLESNAQHFVLCKLRRKQLEQRHLKRLFKKLIESLSSIWAIRTPEPETI